MKMVAALLLATAVPMSDDDIRGLIVQPAPGQTMTEIVTWCETETAAREFSAFQNYLADHNVTGENAQAAATKFADSCDLGRITFKVGDKIAQGFARVTGSTEVLFGVYRAEVSGQTRFVFLPIAGPFLGL